MTTVTNDFENGEPQLGHVLRTYVGKVLVEDRYKDVRSEIANRIAYRINNCFITIVVAILIVLILDVIRVFT